MSASVEILDHIQSDQAINQRGKYPEAHSLKGDILVSESKWHDALPEYLKALEENPYYAPAWSSIAYVYMLRGDKAAAKYAWSKACDIDPTLDKSFLSEPAQRAVPAPAGDFLRPDGQPITSPDLSEILPVRSLPGRHHN